MNYNFEKWWKDKGRFLDLVNSDLKSEELYKKFAEKVWKESLIFKEDNEKPDCYCGNWD